MNKKEQLKDYIKKTIQGQSYNCDDINGAVDNSIPVLPHDFLKDTPYDKADKFEIPEGKGEQKIKTSKGKFGDLEASWVEEGAVIPYSKEKFHAKTMKPGKLAVLVGTTGEIDQDASYLSTFLRTKLPKAINYSINNAMIYGSDKHNASVKGIVGDSSQMTYFTPETDIEQAIPDMYKKVMFSEDNIWFVGKNVWQDIIENAYGFINWEGKDAYIFGQPVKPVSWLNKDDVVYGDFSFYAISQKPIQQEVSEHFLFDSDQNVLKTTMRLAGEVPYAEPFTTRTIAFSSDEFIEDEITIDNLSSIDLYTMTLNTSGGSLPDTEQMVVSGFDVPDTGGAPDPDLNQTYVFDGMINDRPSYVGVDRDNWTITYVDLDPQTDEFQWQISDELSQQAYYFSYESVETPDLAVAWFPAASGDEPGTIKPANIGTEEVKFTYAGDNLFVGDNCQYIAEVSGNEITLEGEYDTTNQKIFTLFMSGSPFNVTELSRPDDDGDINNIVNSGGAFENTENVITITNTEEFAEAKLPVSFIVSYLDNEGIFNQETINLNSDNLPGIDYGELAVSNNVAIGMIGDINENVVISFLPDTYSEFISVAYNIGGTKTIDWSEYDTVAYWSETTEETEYTFAALSAMQITQ